MREFNARFTDITQLGHAITCRGKIVAVEGVRGERCARVQLSATNQYGECKITAEAVLTLD